jgi:acyl-coenzyme A thioesterase PaaI-like protein
MAAQTGSPLIGMYNRLEGLPFGKRIFSLSYQLAAPYFLSIPASINDVAPGTAHATMRAVPWTRNHLGTVHAIALCNLAEYAMGAVAEATIPPTHRWVPKGMTVEYKAKARGRMHATAILVLPEPLTDKLELPVAIEVTDDDAVAVFSAEIRIWVTERPASAGDEADES